MFQHREFEKNSLTDSVGSTSPLIVSSTVSGSSSVLLRDCKMSFRNITAQSHRKSFDSLTFSLAKQLATLNDMSPFFQAMSFLVELDIILSTVLSKCFLNLFTKRWLVYEFILSCFPPSVMYTLLYLSSNWDTFVGVFFSITRLLTNAMRTFNAEDFFSRKTGLIFLSF